jgi:hypothetical protein
VSKGKKPLAANEREKTRIRKEVGDWVVMEIELPELPEN